MLLKLPFVAEDLLKEFSIERHIKDGIQEQDVDL